MAAVQMPQKMCVVCGTDVSGKPRVKDDRGRYTCQGSCQAKFAKMVEAKAPSAPPPVVDSSFMDHLVSASPMMNVTNCPSCNSPMPGGGVLCTRCGFNTQTGKAVKTRVVIEKQRKDSAAPARRGEFGPSAEVLLAISCLAFVVLAGLGAVNYLVWAVATLLIFGAYAVAYIWTIVMAFRQGETRYGIFGLLCVIPFVNLISLAFIYFGLALNEDKWSRAMFSGAFLGYVIVVAEFFLVHGGTLAKLSSSGGLGTP